MRVLLIALFLGATGIVFGVAPVTAEVVLCKSSPEQPAQAREDGCKPGEIEVAMSASPDASAAQDYLSQLRADITEGSFAVECDADHDVYTANQQIPLN